MQEALVLARREVRWNRVEVRAEQDARGIETRDHVRPAGRRERHPHLVAGVAQNSRAHLGRGGLVPRDRRDVHQVVRQRDGVQHPAHSLGPSPPQAGSRAASISTTIRLFAFPLLL